MNYKKLLIYAVVVIIVLTLFISYVFIIKPQIDKYIQNKQVEAGDYIVNQIINVAEQQRYIQLSSGNKSAILILYEPQG